MITPKRIVNFVVISAFLFPVLFLTAYFTGVIIVPVLTAWAAGWAIVFTGFVFELLLVKRGLTRSDKSFVRNGLGAISIRLFITVTIVIICLVFLELNQNNFIFSILIFYFFYLIIEIIYLNFRKY